jgi:hypothetical protein
LEYYLELASRSAVWELTNSGDLPGFGDVTRIVARIFQPVISQTDEPFLVESRQVRFSSVVYDDQGRLVTAFGNLEYYHDDLVVFPRFCVLGRTNSAVGRSNFFYIVGSGQFIYICHRLSRPNYPRDELKHTAEA